MRPARGDGSASASAEIVLRIAVRPAGRGIPWAARIEDGAATQEFHDPLELARHLARLGTTGEPLRGLR